MSSRILQAGLIGENISRSRFADALELLCQRDGIELKFDPFDTTQIDGFDFNTHINALKNAAFDGVTVTHPYKTAADALSDVRRDYPEWLGASNLLRFEADGTHSFNTDYSGLIAAWRARFGDESPGHVAMAGAGGVARAIVAALIELGATGIEIWDMNRDAVDELVEQVDPDQNTVIPIAIEESIPAVLRADGVVNATPMGMNEYPGSAFHPLTLLGRTWAFDAVYTPIKTEFLKAAKESGVQCLSGFELFKNMAVASYAIYTGTKPRDADVLDSLSVGL